MQTPAIRVMRLRVLVLVLAGLMNSLAYQPITPAAASTAKSLRDSRSPFGRFTPTSDLNQTFKADTRAGEAWGKLPLSFETNRGQADARVKFVSCGNGFTLHLTPTDTRLTLKTEPRTDLGSRDRVIDSLANHGGSSGVVDVVVSNPDGQSAVLKKGFTLLLFPQITSVSIEGKELAVFGFDFDKGALILIGGSVQKTRQEISNSIVDPFLLSKKAARKIVPGQAVTIQVRNANGLVSAPVSYNRPAN